MTAIHVEPIDVAGSICYACGRPDPVTTIHADHTLSALRLCEQCMTDLRSQLGVSVFAAHAGLARRDGPETSKAAAKQVTVRSGTQRRWIMELLESVGEYGATDHEIESTLRMKHTPRRLECVQAGWVEDSKRRRQTDTGVEAEVWTITPTGRLALVAERQRES